MTKRKWQYIYIYFSCNGNELKLEFFLFDIDHKKVEIFSIYNIVKNIVFVSTIVAPLKNALDWASRPPNVWADKAAAIVSAGGSFGGGRSHYHLRQIGVYLDLHFINKPELFVFAFQPPTKFDSNGNLIDEETKERLNDVLLSLQAFTLRLKD